MQDVDSKVVSSHFLQMRVRSACYKKFVRWGGGMCAWTAYMLVAGAVLIPCVLQAAYKPVDISDITGEQKKALVEVWAKLRRMPARTRECFISEQLGLLFRHESDLRTSSGMIIYSSHYVGRNGKVVECSDARNAASESWSDCSRKAREFRKGAVLVPFKKEVHTVVLNTARYLLKSVSSEQRYCLLATMGGMLFDAQGEFKKERVETGEGDDGTRVTCIDVEHKDYRFLDPEGGEHDVQRDYVDARYNYQLRMIWRCENLVGARDILALFPEDVKAMRAQYRGRIARVKTGVDSKE